MRITHRISRSSLALLLPSIGIALAVACSSSSKGSADDDTSNTSSGETSDGGAQDPDEVEGSDDDGAGSGASDGDGQTSDGETGSVGGNDGEDGAGSDGMVDASVPDDGDDPGSLIPGGDSGTTIPDFVEIQEGDDGSIIILCGDSPCACSDGEDNDADGLLDGMDSECTGPFDNDESTFATGIPGDNSDPKWQDCFFDGNSGAGDDGCRYRTECLTGELDASDPGCQITDQCRDFCAPLAPPGCDCFGCCDVTTADGEMLHILVSATCSLDVIEDEQACPRCQPTEFCANECGECEICIGQTLEDLPDSCWPAEPPPDDGSGGSGGSGGTGDPPGSGGSGGSGGSPGTPDGSGGMDGQTPPPDEPPPNLCDNGQTACVVSSDCAADEFCSLGCCKRFTTAR